MLKAVIFDMDGVIIDSEPIYYRACNSILNKTDCTMTMEEYYSYVGKPAFEIWEGLRKKYSLRQSVEELIQLNRQAYCECLKSNCDIEPIEGVGELIVDLYKNSVKLAVASSSSQEIIQIILDKFGIKKYFSVIVSGDEVKEGKSSPRIFLHTAEKLKVNPWECIVIEDSHDGIRSTKEAGMKCVAFNNPSSGTQALDKSDLIIERFKDIGYHKLLGI
jgi:HAD superfamily hydrolase (TIGR01509 family)